MGFIFQNSPFLIFPCSRLKIAAHIIEERIEPQVAAIPIGRGVSVKRIEAKYAPGMRTKMIEITLCKNA